MKKILITLTIGSYTMLTSAWAQQNDANRMKEADSSFAMKAAQGGMAEVELGNLAMQKATDAKVKAFAQQMVTDHTKANDDLKSVATKDGMTLPTTLDSKDMSTKSKLSNLQGADFDKSYMEDMVSDHEKDVSEFQHEADHGTNPDLKAFAQRTLPVLQNHLQMAKDALAEVKKTGK